MPGRPVPKPEWLKVRLPGGERYRRVKRAVESGGLNTVCREARCPNVGECWDAGTATFMILGDSCTRGCRFCSVRRANPGGETDLDEPRRVARAASEMGLDYAVVTSVTRDDLEDGGAAVFADTIHSLRSLDPAPLVEVLIPDYLGEPLATVIEAGPVVLAHNIEVVERLSGSMRHSRFSYRRSLEVLEEARRLGGPRGMLTKSSILLGLGESRFEIVSAMRDLREAGVSLLVLGQYLRPTRSSAEVAEYVRPEVFDELTEAGREMGFDYVASTPLARTSYRAAEAYVKRLRAARAG
ncbi:MAG: lipoyl synthase [Polyangia bacterium]